MGIGESKSNWQEDYLSSSLPSDNPQYLKHKTTGQKCELLSLPIIPQDQSRYIERIQLRRDDKKSPFLTPLVKWQVKKDQNICGNKQQLQLIFGEVSPTLHDFLMYRRVANQIFTEEEIMYVIRNVSYGLKDIQNMKEEHGKVELSTICVTNDVFLKDSLLISEEEKLTPQRKSIKTVEGFPSPQKLRTYYDSLTGFEEMRGDLFSLGVVALQLYYSRQDIKSLYMNPDPRYRNYSINLQGLAFKISQIPHFKLRIAIEKLTNMQSKKRLQIFDMLRETRINPNTLNMLRENVNIMTSNLADTNKTAPIAIENKQITRGPNGQRIQYRFSAPGPQVYSQYGSPLIMQHNSQNNNETFRPKQAQKSPLISTSVYNPPISSQYSSQFYTNTTKPEMTGSHYFSNPLTTFTKEDNHLSSIYPSSSFLFKQKNQPIYTPFRMTYEQNNNKNAQINYASTNLKSPQLGMHTTYNTSTGAASTGYKVPTFQEILEKVRKETQLSGVNPPLEQKPESTTSLEQPGSYYSSFKYQFQTHSSENSANIGDFSAFKTKLTSQNNSYIPRSAIVAGSQSIYQEDSNQSETKPKEQSAEKKVYNIETETKKIQEQLRQPITIKYKEEELQREVKQETRQNEGINNAISTVSAIPEEAEHQMKESQDSHRVKEIQLFNEDEIIANASLRKVEESFRSIPGLKSDPKIVVVQPLDIEPSSPSSPLKQQSSEPIFVTQEYEVGTKYQGQMLNGKRHGKGKFFYKEGSYYDGQWQDNKMHGFGTLYYPNGTIAYQGDWKNDQFDGKGKVYNDQQRQIDGDFDYTDFNQLDDEWIKYVGDLKNDAKDGLGRLYLTNGNIYQGQFQKDMVHGVGVFKTSKSEKRGIWQYGRLKRLQT